MKLTLRVCSVVICAAAGFTPAAAQQPGNHDIVVQSKQLNLRGAFDVYPSRHWDHGALIVMRRQGSPSEPAVEVFNKDGDLVRKVVVWFDGAVEVSLTSAAMFADGRLIVAGGSHDAKGVIANFLAEVTAEGAISRVLRINPFIAQQICASDRDGTVWALGWPRDRRRDQGGGLLRDFDIQKGEIASAVDRLSTNLAMGGRYPSDTQLVCTHNDVLLYEASTGELHQIDLSTKKETVVQIEPVDARTQLSGLYMPTLEKAVASFHVSPDGGKPGADGLFSLQPEASAQRYKWVPLTDTLQLSSPSQSGPLLLGGMGSTLVLTTWRDPGHISFVDIQR